MPMIAASAATPTPAPSPALAPVLRPLAAAAEVVAVESWYCSAKIRFTITTTVVPVAVELGAVRSNTGVVTQGTLLPSELEYTDQPLKSQVSYMLTGTLGVTDEGQQAVFEMVEYPLGHALRTAPTLIL